jgi:arginyl-tRNA synthetase
VPSSATRWHSLLAFAGYDVTREYYINDAGAQVDVLAAPPISAIARRSAKTSADAGRPVSRRLPEARWGNRSRQKYGREFLGKDEADWLPMVRKEAMTQCWR